MVGPLPGIGLLAEGSILFFGSTLFYAGTVLAAILLEGEAKIKGKMGKRDDLAS